MPMEKAPQLPLKFRILLHLHSFTSSVSRRSNITVNRCFINLFDPKIPSSSKPCHGVFTMDTILDPTRNLWFRLCVPSSISDVVSMPVVVYYHGSGFVLFSSNSMPYDDLCRRFARDLGAVIVSVNYRLSPEQRYPCQYDDGFDVLKFLDGMDPDTFPAKADLNRCFIAGDSTGGNLAHHVVVRASNYDFKKVNIKGLIAIQPFFGGEDRTESEIRFKKSPMLNLEQADWYWKAFLPKGSDRNHPATHVFGGDIYGVKFPATLLIVGGVDQLQDWGRKYYEWLKGAGKKVELVEYSNAIHGFYAVLELSDASLLMKDASDFIQRLSAV